MTWPVPVPGLVIRYAYLWDREARNGREEGSKDRPCAIVVAVQTEDDRTRVYALPITHSLPMPPDEGIEFPRTTKIRLGLDDERAWVIVSEANAFVWPGPDLRFVPSQGPASVAYGILPPDVLRVIRDRFVLLARNRRTRLVPRSE